MFFLDLSRRMRVGLPNDPYRSISIPRFFFFFFFLVKCFAKVTITSWTLCVPPKDRSFCDRFQDMFFREDWLFRHDRVVDSIHVGNVGRIGPTIPPYEEHHIHL